MTRRIPIPRQYSAVVRPQWGAPRIPAGRLGWQTAKEAAFRLAVDMAVDEAMRGDDEAASWVHGVLSEFRDNLLSALARMAADPHTSEWQLWRLGGLRQAVDDAAVRLQQRYLDAQFRALDAAWESGQATTGGALAKAGWKAAGDVTAGVSTTQLEIMRGYSATLVKHITDRARARIDQELLALSLGSKTPTQAMAAIEGLLRSPDRMGPGYPADLSRQAERVIRTERMRVLNLSAWARLQALDEATGGGVKKKWLHGGGGKDPRPYHRDTLNGQVIGLAEHFNVNGHPGRFPHDPALPAAEVINCTCTIVPYMSHWAEYDERTGAKERRAALRAKAVDEWRERYPPRDESP